MSVPRALAHELLEVRVEGDERHFLQQGTPRRFDVSGLGVFLGTPCRGRGGQKALVLSHGPSIRASGWEEAGNKSAVHRSTTGRLATLFSGCAMADW